MGCTSSQPAAAAAPPPPPVPEEFVAEMQQKVKQTVRRSSMWENDDDDAAADLARLCNEIKVDQRPDDAGGGSDTASGTEPDDDNEIAVMTKARLQMGRTAADAKEDAQRARADGLRRRQEADQARRRRLEEEAAAQRRRLLAKPAPLPLPSTRPAPAPRVPPVRLPASGSTRCARPRSAAAAPQCRGVWMIN